MATKPAQILYMEDNEGTARLLEKRLRRAGYIIDTVSSGESGLERCTTRTYDVIIVDYNMPGLNGVELARRHERLAQVLEGHGHACAALEGHAPGDHLVERRAQ